MDIALATSADYPGLDEDSVPLLDALRALGLRCEPRVWDSGFDPTEARLCLLRSTWDYDSRRDEFLAWVRATAARVPILPSLETVAWNTDKSYLRDLEARGAQIVPTAWLARGDQLEHILESRGWERAVVKPAVGAGSRGLLRIGRGEAAQTQGDAEALLERGEVMVQPFLESVESHGELSLLFADGELTHAVRKLARPGDFRVQPEYGGTFALETPGADAVEAAQAAVASLGEPPVLARVDLVAGDDGNPLLIELELVEPRLFLRAAPATAPSYAEAIARRLAGTLPA